METTSPLAAAPAAAPSADLLGGLVGTLSKLLSLGVVKRTTPLAAPITVTQTIGSAGGTLSIPAAGVTVIVPKGAVSSPVVFSMTARAGSAIAYDFAPHGIVFAKPLVFKQSLQKTTVSLLQVPTLNLGYYSDPSLIGATTALVSQLLGGTFDILTWTFTSSIPHFSGYVMTCGRGGAFSE
jgi:ZU5 domain